MTGGKRTSFRRTQIRQDERHLPAKFRPERVDGALELGTVRSTRQKDLHDRRLCADGVEAAVSRLTGQRDHCHNGGDHPGNYEEKRQPPPSAALTLRYGLLPRRLVTLPHRLDSCGGGLTPRGYHPFP